VRSSIHGLIQAERRLHDFSRKIPMKRAPSLCAILKRIGMNRVGMLHKKHSHHRRSSGCWIAGYDARQSYDPEPSICGLSSQVSVSI
jgi:hypothetical protein